MDPIQIIVITIVCLVACVLGTLWYMGRTGVSFYLTKQGIASVQEIDDAEGDPVRVLDIGGRYQSATYLGDRANELVFSYYKAYDLLFDAVEDPRHILMVGGGGYSYPKHCLTQHPEVSMDVAEIDPKVTKIAWKHFYLAELVAFANADEERLGLMCADGRKVMEEVAAGEERYDAICNDSFVGSIPAPGMATLEAARAAHGALVPGGAYLSNVLGEPRGSKSAFLNAEVATLMQVFAHVYVVPCVDVLAGVPNNMVIATDRELNLPGAVDFVPAEGSPIITDVDNITKRLAAEL